ncbi:hypothetical protein NDU88_008071 [Pleurodeles waltl]|uniref:Uncharacterized protein n=1 Tax=Pleurodeles waltl TaxID=8319 RepID=A0AAV7SUB4_PLEWA|nr:hypothetical protein NDU88_008071 [Pleurodeles waltl]
MSASAAGAVSASADPEVEPSVPNKHRLFITRNLRPETPSREREKGFLFRVSGGRDSTSSGCDITSGRSLLLSPPVLMVLPDSCLRKQALNAWNASKYQQKFCKSTKNGQK